MNEISINEIGDFPIDWEIKPLSAILENKVTYGIVQPGFHDDNGIPILRVNNIRNGIIDDNEVMRVSTEIASKYNRTKLKGGEILITLVGNLGELAIVPEKHKGWNIARAVGLLNLKDKTDNYWIYTWLSSKQITHYIKTHANTTVQHTLNLSDVESLPIVLPPKLERDALANIVASFNKKITLLRQQNQDLEELAQTLFKRWFVEFEFPFDFAQGKPNKNGEPLALSKAEGYKSSGGKMVESELGEIPEGWRVGYLNTFILNSIGGDYGNEEITGDFTEEATCLRGTDLPDMKTGLPLRAPVRFIKALKLKKCQLNSGDIVIEISGGTENQSTGRVMYINNEILTHFNRPMTCVNFCRILRPRKEYYSYFTYLLLQYLYDKGIFFNLENGTTGIKNLDIKTLLNDFELIIPTNELVEKLDVAIRLNFVKIQENNKEIQTLTQLRDTLLQKVMSGELRVQN